MYTNDYDLLGRSLNDVIIEPLRSILIPKFEKVKSAAIENGALGAGISGSGPSIFALSKGKETAEKVAKAIETIYAPTGITFDIHVASINADGVTKIKS